MSRAVAIRKFLTSTLLSGFLVVVPIYLAVLLLLKAMNTVMGVVRPVAKMLKLPEWLPSSELLALLAIAFVCFLVGVLIRTQLGESVRERIEQSLLKRIPGYATIRGLTRRLAGESEEKTWRPALAEIEEALVPAFIIEELRDGRLTIFVPSVPTPFAGTVYIIDAGRVHPVNIPFAQAIRVISQWGGGAAAFVAALEKP